jgi:hypothetical protein
MSEVRAVRGSAEGHLPPDSYPAPKRDEGEAIQPRRPPKRKTSDVEISAQEAHQLDVEA